MPDPTFLPPADIDRARNGDFNAIADMLESVRRTMNATVQRIAEIVPDWKSVEFVAANYKSFFTVGVWTVVAANVEELKYIRIGPLVVLAFELSGSVLTADATLLTIRIPELRVRVPDTAAHNNPCIIGAGATSPLGWCYVTNILNVTNDVGCVLNFEVADGSDFLAAAGNVTLAGMVAFEVEG